MERAVIHFIILGVISGLTKGAGVLPDEPLNAAVGGTVMFSTTLTPSEKTFTSIGWTFGSRNIIAFSGNNVTAPEYEGRITLFMSTGSLELRNLALSDSGEYKVIIFSRTGSIMDGSTMLKVDDETSGCAAGCIAGIVITCLVVLGAAAGGGYYTYKKKINNKAPQQSGQKEVEEQVYENM